IMHQHLSEEELAKKEVLETVERQANMFAACFLMPPETFTADIRDTTLRGFLSLKSKWGTSAKAMITHSKRYDHRMTDSAATELYRQMSARGMNKAKGEPFDDVVPEVSSSLTRKALDLVKENGLRQPWEIPFELPLPKVSLQVALSMTPEELIKSGDGTESKIIELRSGRTAEFQHLFHQARPPV
ncbi:MAG TPA: ImmA/IrrE family metallo-endopeptidase, partial [Prosthecobacter sp.]